MILQAPDSMRAVLQALNTITVAVGNTIDLIIVSSTDKILPKQVLFVVINPIVTRETNAGRIYLSSNIRIDDHNYFYCCFENKIFFKWGLFLIS